MKQLEGISKRSVRSVNRIRVLAEAEDVPAADRAVLENPRINSLHPPVKARIHEKKPENINPTLTC